MRIHRGILAALAGAALVPAASAQAVPPPALAGLSHRPVCPSAPVGAVRCHSQVVTDAAGQPVQAAAPFGYGANDVESAYALPTSAGAGQTVAIVDAYDDPSAESDLNAYRSYYSAFNPLLTPCTTANGCFSKVAGDGSNHYPRPDTGWAQEISLDLDMVSATCPSCHILLVEARSNRWSDLRQAEATATASGAHQVSNSWGGGEFSLETSSSYDGTFDRPGVAITASSGDSGYGVQYPAASRYVTAVGGTSLVPTTTTGRGWAETAWSGAGSGCSAYESKPSWQRDTGCARRAVADVSATADPQHPVAVYDSFRSTAPWQAFGGTSVAAPLIAGVYALAGNGASVVYGSYPYAHAGSLYDVISGSNGSCGGGYLCSAATGYDGPTGLGTPNGSGAF